MSRFGIVLTSGVLVVGLSASPRAATLFTAPLPGGGTGVYCQAVNVTPDPRDVTLEVRDATGTTVNTTTCVALDPAHACTLAVPGAGTPPHSCRIDVAGSKKTVRASIVRLTSDSVPAVALPAE
jgi:hypothetical protein